MAHVTPSSLAWERQNEEQHRFMIVLDQSALGFKKYRLIFALHMEVESVDRCSLTVSPLSN